MPPVVPGVFYLAAALAPPDDEAAPLAGDVPVPASPQAAGAATSPSAAAAVQPPGTPQAVAAASGASAGNADQPPSTPAPTGRGRGSGRAAQLTGQQPPPAPGLEQSYVNIGGIPATAPPPLAPPEAAPVDATATAMPSGITNAGATATAAAPPMVQPVASTISGHKIGRASCPDMVA